jgi:4-hydroxybenzoate polyprenyltransferase
MFSYEKLKAYNSLMRLDKPIGTLLLLWPTLTALFIASHGHPIALTTFVFLVGVMVLRAAGCIVNDIFDRNFDRHVKRTQARPMTTGKVSVPEALLVLTCLLFFALLLVLLLNHYTLFLAVIGALLVVIYPLMKRITHLPQLFLGIVFNWGILLAFTAETEHLSFIAWLIFFIAALWTVAYDTIYAMVDRDDDIKIGIKSTAILFGDSDRLIIGYLQMAVIFLLFVLGFIIKATFWFYLSVLCVLLLFAYQQLLIKEREPTLCFKAFLNNHWAWMVIFIGVFLNYSS